jgi:periplasmic divalent cation tolerance protein
MKADSVKYCVVLVTAASEEQAQIIAQALLAEKLAACVNIYPVTSLYIWQGELNREREWQLLIKSSLSHFDHLAEKIEELHSYEVPEIIALPIIDGSESYLNWISRNLG